MNGSSSNPKIFISYSWSSPDHEKWVLDLAERLMSHAVMVVLDKWDLKEGQDKFAFMEKMVQDEEVNKVLIICDKQYAEKANSRNGGVGTETQLISKKVYENTAQEKFIPIIKEKNEKGEPYAPDYIASRLFIDLSDDQYFEQNYEKLLRNIYGKPLIKKPSLGIPPAFIQEGDENLHLITTQKKSEIKRVFALRRNTTSNGLEQDFLNTFLHDMKKFTIRYNNDPEYDEKVVKSIEDMKVLRDNFVDFTFEVFKYQQNVDLEEFKTFFENLIAFKVRTTIDQPYSEIDYDNYKFIIYELYLYFIACLISLRKFKELSFFVNTTYFYESWHGEGLIYSSMVVFNGYSSSLDQTRNKRLNLNRISIMSDMLKQRASRDDILFKDIFQADLLLYYLSNLNRQHMKDVWFPRTSVYGSRFNKPVILFEKMISKNFFNNFKNVLRVSTQEELVSNIEDMLEAQTEKSYDTFYYNIPQLNKFIDTDKIALLD